jgi:hypothetical protein
MMVRAPVDLVYAGLVMDDGLSLHRAEAVFFSLPQK